MGLAPPRMTPIQTGAKFFGGICRYEVYVGPIETPPIPWPLRFGWTIITLALVIGVIAIKWA